MNSSVPFLGKQNLIRTNKGTLLRLTAGITHRMLTQFCTTAGIAVLSLTSSDSLYQSLFADTILHDS